MPVFKACQGAKTDGGFFTDTMYAWPRPFSLVYKDIVHIVALTVSLLYRVPCIELRSDATENIASYSFPLE